MANALKGIGLTALVFLLLIAIHYIVRPTNEWAPLWYVVPGIGIYLYLLIKWSK